MSLGAPTSALPVYIRAAGGIAAGAASLSDLAASAAVPLNADAVPVALRARVAQVAPQVTRMASRFSQLAVLGAADCLAQLRGSLDPATRLYLATGLGDVANTDALYYGVMPPHSEMPPPARFAISGNNMAAFFVAQHAGLAARNLTLSQAELSLECALELALSDIAAGEVRSALLGGVDETTLPRDYYTRRFAVAADQAIGEGSGWLVLDAQPERNGERALGAILGSRVLTTRAPHDGGSWIAQLLQACHVFAPVKAQTPGITLLPGTGIAADKLAALKSALQGRYRVCDGEDYLSWSGRFPTAAAVALAAIATRRRAACKTYLHVNCDAHGRTGVMAFEVYPRGG